MKLEDCTKEELIRIIKGDGILLLYEIEYSIKKVKAESAFEMYKKFNKKAMEHLTRQNDINNKYIGWDIVDIPQNDWDCINKEWELYKANWKIAERYYKKYERLMAIGKE